MVILNIQFDEIEHISYNHYIIQGTEYVHNHKSFLVAFYYESHPHPLTLGHKELFSLIIYLFCFFYNYIKLNDVLFLCVFTKSMYILIILLYIIINLWCCLISMPFLIAQFVFFTLSALEYLGFSCSDCYQFSYYEHSCASHFVKHDFVFW